MVEATEPEKRIRPLPGICRNRYGRGKAGLLCREMADFPRKQKKGIWIKAKNKKSEERKEGFWGRFFQTASEKGRTGFPEEPDRKGI